MNSVVPFQGHKQRFIEWWNKSENGLNSWRNDLQFEVCQSFAQCGTFVFAGDPILFCNHCYNLFESPDPDEIYCSAVCRESDNTEEDTE